MNYTRPNGDTHFQSESAAKNPLASADLDNEYTNLKTQVNLGLPKDGSEAITSDLTLANSTPSNDLHAASKKYVNDQVAAHNATSVHLETGTKALFFQVAAPTGWTIDATHNDKALRVNSVVGGGDGGSLDFSAANVGAHTLTTAEIPAHSHPCDWEDGSGSGPRRFSSASRNLGGTINTNDSTGGGGSHEHTLALKYIDVLVCTKD